MRRVDYDFPFRIDSGSRTGARASGYGVHVSQMIRQVLLTSPGERADLPEFGCGVRRLLFAPNTEALAPTAKVLILQALRRWLPGLIDLRAVDVVPGKPPDEEQVLIRIDYVLLETRTNERLEVLLP
ncbi:MAG TPA: GPW/gp25 family protein [Polyangiales bacterium]|nr:GPW/gp25 family protein [Polyangiales bacterium]